ncbi:MAG: hypothetical protein JWO38_1234 [Gemmataceae bacterium]|nr:hypothetical protein [Gemmataceae bacterium]
MAGWTPIRGESWAGGRGSDFAERTQSTRFLHTSGRADPLGPGRFCGTNPIRIGPPRVGPTAGAVGRLVLQNEANPGSGPHPVGGRFCGTNPIVITRSGSPPDCQPGPDGEVTSASIVLGLPNPAIPCHPRPPPGLPPVRRPILPNEPNSRGRSASCRGNRPTPARLAGGRFCRTNPIRAGGASPRTGVPSPVWRPVPPEKSPVAREPDRVRPISKPGAATRRLEADHRAGKCPGRRQRESGFFCGFCARS